MASDRRRSRTWARRRVAVLFVVIAVLATAFALLDGRDSAQADGPSAPLAVQVHTVVSGETLWGIARDAAQDGQDVRDVILDIAELNGMTGQHIEPGMRIMLPAQAVGA